MNLVSLDSVSLSLGEGPLFTGVSLGIEEGERIGFVGPNGAGKSSFLSLLSGTLLPDGGTVARKRGLMVNVLDQDPRWEPGDTIRAFLFRSEDPLVRLAGRYEACLAAVHGDSSTDGSVASAAGGAPGPGSAAAEELERLGREMEERGGFELDRRFASFLSELGLGDLSVPMAELSGGMAKKAALARCLAPDADLYLLDEPTNHLDLDTIEWLERRLLSMGRAFVLVTHDRWFLDSVCTTMMDLDGGLVRKYDGGYSDYLRRRSERDAQVARHEERREAILRVEHAWLLRGPKARAGKDKKRKERAAAMEAGRPEDEAPTSDAFRSATRRLGGKILELRGACKSFGGKTVLAPFDWTLSKGQRIGIVGPNGSGKSTLLDLVSGRLESDAGSVVRGETVAVGYFDQHASAARRELEALDFVREAAERIVFDDGTELSAEQFLERFGFPRAMFRQDLSSLSGGELRRLALVRLLIGAPNLLLLDEPTNDFDISTIALLEDFVNRFQGCVLVVSHDRAFLEGTVDSLLVLDGQGGVAPYVGSYADWREERAERERRERQDGSEKDGAAVGRGRNSRQAGEDGATSSGLDKKRRLSFKEAREFDGLLPRIDELEAERAELEARFADPTAALAKDATAMADSRRRYETIGTEIDALTARWEELAERADA